MNKKYAVLAVVCLLAGLCIAAAAVLGSRLFGSAQGEEPPLVSEASPSPDAVESEPPETTEEEEVYVSPIDFDALWERNPEIFGWLDIPGTVISYPMVQSATDNSFYLRRDVDGNYALDGSIFVENYNHTDMSDPVTLIYGHHMLSGAMFGTLQQTYSDAETFAECGQITIYLPEQELHYTVCAAVPYDNRHIMLSFDFDNAYGFDLFWESITSVRAISAQFNEEVEVSYGDRLIVLSTCLSGDNTKRYLVAARLQEEP